MPGPTTVEDLSPRWPDVSPATGHYESTYLVASHPSEPLTAWIRYTVHQRPRQPATASIWFTLFDHGTPTAAKVTTTDVRCDSATGSLLVVGEHGAVRPDGADGSVVGHGVEASWTLAFTALDTGLRHLPRGWMYAGAFPRTKSTSPYPAMRVDGSITVSGHTLDVDGWRGMLGHNWGKEHAHRWIWLRAAGFAQSPDGWLDVVVGRIRLGSITSPWIANGAFAPAGPEGPRHRVGGLMRRVSVRERVDGCDLVIRSDTGDLSVSVDAPASASVGWVYADPSGGQHQVRNCSQAGVVVTIADRSPLRTAYGGVYELGSPTGDPAVVVQPYGDG